MFKLAVAPVVRVPVKFSAADGAKTVPFSFTLICKRLGQDEVSARIKGEGETVQEFMGDVVTGWEGQTLVLEEATGQPAPFSPEALQAMLNFPGSAVAAYQAYLKNFGAKEKN